jgi:predicted DCC family thiol-disulfide oxidoreductase YuxK
MVSKNEETQQIDGAVTPIILLDGECTLCNRLALFLSKRLHRRKELTFLAIESDSGQRLIQSFPKKLRDLDTIYFLDGPKIYSRSAAVLHCLRFMRWYYAALFPLLWIIPLPLRDALYRLVAKYRYKIFGKNFSCVYPNLNDARKRINETS